MSEDAATPEEATAEADPAAEKPLVKKLMLPVLGAVLSATSVMGRTLSTRADSGGGRTRLAFTLRIRYDQATERQR